MENFEKEIHLDNVHIPEDIKLLGQRMEGTVKERVKWSNW